MTRKQGKLKKLVIVVMVGVDRPVEGDEGVSNHYQMGNHYR